jgi:hypothetical protein
MEIGSVEKEETVSTMNITSGNRRITSAMAGRGLRTPQEVSL